MDFIEIKGYNGKYVINSCGMVKNTNCNRLLKHGIMKTGYPAVSLFDDNKCQKLIPVHRLLAIHFIENDDPFRKKQVNHINGDRADNRLENLEWVSQRENLSHGKLRLANKSSKYIGVTFRKAKRVTSKQWEVCIRIDGKRVGLGTYHTEYEAHLVYQKALTDYGLFNKYK